MSLLSIVSDVCRQTGVPLPQSVVGSSDPITTRMLGLANKEGKALSTRFRWQATIREAHFLTTGVEDQGNITVLAPFYSSIINDTLWDSNRLQPIFGSLAAARWQLAHARLWSGPFFRIRGNRLLLTPILPAGITVKFEYHSRAWVNSPDGLSFYNSWSSDQDIGLLDEDLMTDGLLWRWKCALGFEYAEDFATYERNFADLSTRDVPHGISTMADPEYAVPGRYARGSVVITPIDGTTPPPVIPPVIPPVEPPIEPPVIEYLTTTDALMEDEYEADLPIDLITREQWLAILALLQA